MPRPSSELQSLQGWKVPPRVVRVLGDSRFRLESQLLALHPLWDGSTWTVEEPGLLRKWTTLGGQESFRSELSDLEMLWAFGGDAPRLASAADDLTFWNVATGESLQSVRQPAWITALAFRADGSMLATGHDDGRVRLWDVPQGKLVREWQQQKQPVTSLAFSADGSQLAAGTEDRSIILFQVIHGVHSGALKGHTDRIARIAWHPSGRYLATASWDTTSRVWDVERGEQIYILNGQGDQVHAAVFSPDGKLLASADSQSMIWLWDPFQGKVIRQLPGHAGEVTQLAFTPDGCHLLSGGGDGRLLVWNAANGENVLHASGESTQTSRVSLSPQSDQVAAILGGRNIFVWDAQDGKRVGTLESLPSRATALLFHGHSRRLASGHDEGQIVFWNTRSGQADVLRHEHTSRITCMALDEAGRRLATGGSMDGYVYLWAMDSAEPMLLIPGATEGCTVETLAFVPGTDMLAVAGVDWKSSGQEGCVCLWDVQKPERLATQPLGSMSLAVRPDGKQLALATLSESICFMTLPDLEVEGELQGHQGLVTSVAYTSDGRHLLSCGVDGTLRVWDVATGKELQNLETDVSIRDLALSPDNRFVYTANANATLHVIDLQRA